MRFALPLILLCAANLSAQQPVPAPIQVFGSVTVHVVLADTNQPARLASVALQPAGEVIPPQDYKNPPKTASGALIPPVTLYKTGLDGTVLIPRTPPGRYYVVVEQSGYLSLAAQISREEFNKPDEETKALIEKTVPIVAVAAQQSSTVTVRLIHAATVTGTIRYDDGAPYCGVLVSVQRHSKSGDWVSIGTSNSSYGRTDDQGHYRISGLAAGEYRADVSLNLGTTRASNVFEQSGVAFGYQLRFFSGDTIRESEAKTFKLGDGENSTNNDITIPVAKLRSVTGSLLEASSGHVINSGNVYLYFPGEKYPVAFAKVGEDEPVFRFEFVPEGEYILKVKSAHDVRRDDIPPAQTGSFSPYAARFKETLLKTYGAYEAPFSLHTDVTGLTLPLPEEQQKPKAK